MGMSENLTGSFPVMDQPVHTYCVPPDCSGLNTHGDSAVP